jgi:CubicO group peptidase (beta-lactamase class C family)
MIETRLREAMAEHVERGAVPGLVALVSRHGEGETLALGTLAAGGAEPMRRDTIFRITSMTKPVTAAAALILAEERGWSLDEPIERWLPELANRRVLRRLEGPLDDTVPATRAITLRDLLSFRLGFGIVLAPPGTYPIQKAADELALGQGSPAPEVPPEPEEWLRRFATLPLMHQPGEAWMYHTGSDLLGVFIARASGQAFESYLRERVFEPLGMADTGFFVPRAKLARFATQYETQPGGALALHDEPASGAWSRPPAFPSGGAGLVSTADDYLAFARMLLGRGRQLLSRASLDAMTRDQLEPAQREGGRLFLDGRGWGFGVATGPGARYGWDGGFGTSWANDPSTGTIGILLTQAAWTSPEPPRICVDFWSASEEGAR